MKNRNEKVTLHAGDAVVLDALTRCYYNRTDEEMKEYYDLFAKNGQEYDDAGEPRIVSRMAAITLSSGATRLHTSLAFVASSGGAGVVDPWDSWRG